MSQLHIGLDLDNTLINYDRVFGEVATEIGLLPLTHELYTKQKVKAFLRMRSKGEREWMMLQGQVYGRCIEKAQLSQGAADFLHTVRGWDARISVVSHKTRYGHFDAARVDLWEAAMGWLEARQFFTVEGFGLERNDVHFLETRHEKVMRIAQIGCRVFVDDLREILQHENFPSGALGILFGGSEQQSAAEGLNVHRTWTEVAATIATIPRGSLEVGHRLDLSFRS